MAASLPDELLARILSPVDSIRSLVQARAVCKSWQAAVESKQVRDLRDTTTADPLIALTGGGLCGRGYSDDVATNKLGFKLGRDGPWFAGPPMPETRIQHGAGPKPPLLGQGRGGRPGLGLRVEELARPERLAIIHAARDEDAAVR